MLEINPICSTCTSQLLSCTLEFSGMLGCFSVRVSWPYLCIICGACFKEYFMFDSAPYFMGGSGSCFSLYVSI